MGTVSDTHFLLLLVVNYFTKLTADENCAAARGVAFL